MFNVYSFERKVLEDEQNKEQEDKNRKVRSTHRKMRDMMAENYQKRVALFIREMVDSPVRHNDEYSIRLKLNTSKVSDNRNRHFMSLTNENKSIINDQELNKNTKRSHNSRYQGHRTTKSINNESQKPLNYFRYSNFRTEKERIEATVQANNQFCDSVPSPDKSQFQKSLRQRDPKLDIGPQFRFTAKFGVERVLDQLSKRITTAFETRELANIDEKGTFKNYLKMGQSISPKQLLPSIHHKTHFKAATSVLLKSELESSLKDKSNYLSRALRDVTPSNFKTVEDKSKQLNDDKSIDVNHTSLVIKKDNHIENKIHAVSFEDDEPNLRPESGEIIPPQPEKSESRLKLADLVTKSVLQNCNIIRSKHPNSKMQCLVKTSKMARRFAKGAALRERNLSNRMSVDEEQQEMLNDCL